MYRRNSFITIIASKITIAALPTKPTPHGPTVALGKHVYIRSEEGMRKLDSLGWWLQLISQGCAHGVTTRSERPRHHQYLRLRDLLVTISAVIVICSQGIRDKLQSDLVVPDRGIPDTLALPRSEVSRTPKSNPP
jgi:hypothetical protein